MLRNTFVHIPGVGAKTEAQLWEAGITSWDAFGLSRKDGLSLARKTYIRKRLDASEEYLGREDPCYFFRWLSSRFHWRLFSEFRHVTAYLDIETTGMSAAYDNITVIGVKI